MFGCLFAILAFFMPRVAIVLLWLFSTFITRPFEALQWTLLWPVLGVIFAPYTLLTYCLAFMQNGGKVDGIWLIAVGVAALFDLGLIGQGARSRKKVKRS